MFYSHLLLFIVVGGGDCGVLEVLIVVVVCMSVFFLNPNLLDYPQIAFAVDGVVTLNASGFLFFSFLLTHEAVYF